MSLSVAGHHFIPRLTVIPHDCSAIGIIGIVSKLLVESFEIVRSLLRGPLVIAPFLFRVVLLTYYPLRPFLVFPIFQVFLLAC